MPFSRIGLVVGWLVIALHATSAAEPDMRTVAEISDYHATAKHADVVALCQKLAVASPLVRLDQLGRSGEGRMIPLLIVADPPISRPEDVVSTKKLVALVIGNIHAGEVDGKEALPMLIRDLVAEPHPGLLKDLVLLIAPIYNADGNERISKANRPGQIGPDEGMGIRANAAGLDLNRDFIKLEAPETRALVNMLNRWSPHIFIDTHTTNGSYHRYLLTYQGPQNPAGDGELIWYVRGTMLPEVNNMLRQKTHAESFFYGNFEKMHTEWTSFPALPRFGTNYVGLRGSIAILSEAYSYAPFRDRVHVTRDFTRACLEFAATHRDEIRLRVDDSRVRVTKGALGEKVSIRSEAKAFPSKVTVRGFVQEGPNSAAWKPKDYEVDLVQNFVPTKTIGRPSAYLLPSSAANAKVVELLTVHGLAIEKAGGEFEVETAKIDIVNRAEMPFEGHRLLRLGVTHRRERRTFGSGTTLVRTNQPLGNLAIYLLEPESDDGLATWNVFDPELAPGKDFPVFRVIGTQPSR